MPPCSPGAKSIPRMRQSESWPRNTKFGVLYETKRGF